MSLFFYMKLYQHRGNFWDQVCGGQLKNSIWNEGSLTDLVICSKIGSSGPMAFQGRHLVCLENDSCWKTWVHLSHPYYRTSHHFSKILIACGQAQHAPLPRKGFCITSYMLLFFSLSAAKTAVSCKKVQGTVLLLRFDEPPLAPDSMAGVSIWWTGGW